MVRPERTPRRWRCFSIPSPATRLHVHVNEDFFSLTTLVSWRHRQIVALNIPKLVPEMMLSSMNDPGDATEERRTSGTCGFF